MALLKLAAYWLLSCYRASRKIIKSYHYLHYKRSNNSSTSKFSLFSIYPSIKPTCSIVCDFQGSLLRSPSLFPFFMLVAFEGGSILRAFFLLLSWPLTFVLGDYSLASLRIMAFITFCGLRKRDMQIVARAVLPKFYLENLNSHAYKVFMAAGRKVVVTSMPTVMVEDFLREYLGVEKVVGAELHVDRGRYFTGFMSPADKEEAMKDIFRDGRADLGLISAVNPDDYLFLSHCKEACLVSSEDFSRGETSAVLPRQSYPKPLIFHDGRLAFLPTPMATFTLFLYLPLGFTLALIRMLIGTLLPYKAGTVIGTFTGVRIRVRGLTRSTTSSNTTSKTGGVLYVCTHRTLLDPVMLSTALGKPVTAVTYSLSRMSELLAPMKTVRLTRDRTRDAKTMSRLLQEGDLVVCPEGTTCREPYLLRFSPLFAELAEEIEPVAIDAKTSFFYGTTASGSKWLDPLFFLMNPWPEYTLELLGRVPRELTCAGGCNAVDVANRIQAELAAALGFQPTMLTRRDKYLMLARNEGVVNLFKQHQHAT